MNRRELHKLSQKAMTHLDHGNYAFQWVPPFKIGDEPVYRNLRDLIKVLSAANDDALRVTNSTSKAIRDVLDALSTPSQTSNSPEVGYAVVQLHRLIKELEAVEFEDLRE